MRLALALVVALGALHARADDCLKLWHSYRGQEANALKGVIDERPQDAPCVTVLAVPYDVFASKITTALGQGNGPDVFIFAHERLGDWRRAGLLEPVGSRAGLEDAPEVALKALSADGELWAAPLTIKSLALIYRTDIVETPPRDTRELRELGAALKARGIFALAYPTDSFFFHAPWFFGHRGVLLDDNAQVDFRQPAFAASVDLVRDFQKDGIVPEEASNALVGQLFREGKAAMVISGPWFLSELDPTLPVAVSTLPTVSETGARARPLVTVEAAYIGKGARPGAKALAIALSRGAQRADDAFAAQARLGIVMDARPEMRNVWEPADLALKKALRMGSTGSQAAEAAARRYAIITRDKPAARDARVFRVLVAGLVLFALGFLILRVKRGVQQTGLKETARAWLWIAPAMMTTGVLVLAPFVVAMGLSFFSHDAGRYTFVGLANFTEILSARAYGVLEPLSFYYSLLVTVLWTALNVVVHLGLGMALALALYPKARKLKAVYRVVLILPWAVPNYITALIWKSLFHKQLGAINGALDVLGLEPVSWFSSFSTAFFANLCANWWLGFPFMMLICLGALQSIPSDLYEAAQIDGAGRWQQFRHVTLPLLKPALLPATLLGVVWTFNAFNIVYLVSGGEPEGATDILISEAWRWGFARREQYGYAAAYGVLIFLLLLGWTLLSSRWLKQAEEGR